MDITIVIYIVFAIIITYDILSYLYALFFSNDSNRIKQKRAENIIRDSNFEYDLFDRNAIINAFNQDVIDTNITINNKVINIIDIKNEILCDTFIIGKDIKLIINLNLKAGNVISNSNLFKVKDDAIFDLNDNLIVIFKDKTKEELKYLASSYSISSKALKYFTNAKYAQFAVYKKKQELRFSKPYYDKNEDLEAIVPDVINNKYVEAICVNYANVLDINIPKHISRVVIEKKSNFKNLNIDDENYNFVIYNNTLLDINNNMFINDGFNTFNYIDTENKKNLVFIYKRLSRNYFKLNKLTLNYHLESNTSEVASDLQ